MKSLSKIKFHPFLWLVILISIITGHFKDVLIIMSIILVHELGHILTSYFFKWPVEKIVILPFGGITIFKKCLNAPLLEEFIILISGPLLQFIIFYHFKSSLVLGYSYAILLFNLIPIYPLDGSKIVNIMFNLVLSYKRSLQVSLWISLLSILIFVSFNFYLVTVIILLFPLIETLKSIINIDYIFSMFLLERYKKDCQFKKLKVIEKISNMKRDYYHIINIDGNLFQEREILTKMFDFKKGL